MLPQQLSRKLHDGCILRCQALQGAALANGLDGRLIYPSIPRLGQVGGPDIIAVEFPGCGQNGQHFDPGR